MTVSYIQVPPDSTGKKLATHEHTINGSNVQVQSFHLVDYTDPLKTQKIDGYGAAKITFAEGAPSLTVLGSLRTSNSHLIAKYDNIYSAGSDYTDVLTSGGNIAHDPTTSSTIMSVNSTNGAMSQRTTDRYHYYLPGTSNSIIQTLSLGDAGKTGNIRRWGIYDDNNGIFWELNSTTFRVVVRSSTTGSVVDTPVTQSAWNLDKLDGNGVSTVMLDLTKANLYWIDYAWLGVGAIRFGIYAPNGSRVTCHTIQNPNNNLYAYMQTGMLPLRYENFNTAGTSGTSEIRQICASIYTEGAQNYPYIKLSDIASAGIVVTTDTPVISIRSKLLLGTKTNRASIIPSRLSVYITGGSVKLTLMVKVSSVTGSTWAIPGMASIEGDSAGTAIVGGFARASVMLDAGSHIIDTEDWYSVWDDGLHLAADGTTQPIASVIATKLSGTTVTVDAVINYKELR